MGIKELTTLLRTLRRFGVTRYHDTYVDDDNQRHDLTLELGGVAELPASPAKPRPGEQGFDPNVPFELPELDENDEDPRTLHAELAAKNYPKLPGRPSRTIGPEKVD